MIRVGRHCVIGSRIKPRVSRSTPTAETLSFAEVSEVGVLYKELVSGEISKYMKIDCKSLKANLESTSLVENKRLWIDIAAMKEMIEKEDIEKAARISTREQLADARTKKRSKGLLMTYLLRLILRNTYHLG